MKKDVAVIVVTYNSEKDIVNCISSVYENSRDFSFQVIVVDNCSSDRTVALIEEKFPDVLLVKNSENTGFGQANNLGSRYAQAEYLFFLNPDTVLLNNAIYELLSFLSSCADRSVSICGGLLFNEDGTPQLSAGNFPSLANLFLRHTRLERFLPERHKHKFSIGYEANITKPRAVDYVSGADLMIRAEAFAALSGFDKDFFAYFEETYLCFRAREMGYRSYLVPSARIVHLCGKSMPSSLLRFKIFTKSELAYYHKVFNRRKIAKLCIAVGIILRLFLKPEGDSISRLKAIRKL